MNKIALNHIMKGLLPTPLFFFLSILLPNLLARYSNIGPVRNGQPLIPHWADVISWALILLMAMGFVYSIRQALKLSVMARYGMIFTILLMIPVQYALVLSVSINLFGK